MDDIPVPYRLAVLVAVIVLAVIFRVEVDHFLVHWLGLRSH